MQRKENKGRENCKGLNRTTDHGIWASRGDKGRGEGQGCWGLGKQGKPQSCEHCIGTREMGREMLTSVLRVRRLLDTTAPCADTAPDVSLQVGG